MCMQVHFPQITIYFSFKNLKGIISESEISKKVAKYEKKEQYLSNTCLQIWVDCIKSIAISTSIYR